jgi:aspartate racemase
MKTLGLIGGMSWESTVVYYQLINRRVREKMGGLHSSKCVIYSFDFAEIAHLQKHGNWDEAGILMGEAAASLQRSGAHALVICTNTMHKLASTVELQSGLPVLHIADATAERIKEAGYQRVGLLGTRYTMEQDFYKSRLVDLHGLAVLIPDEKDRGTVDRIIYDELCNGIINDRSREAYIAIVQRLQNSGAQCVILGCTEIGLLLKSDNVALPVFDTTLIHAQAAADWAMRT